MGSIEAKLSQSIDRYQAIGISTYHLSAQDEQCLEALVDDNECNMVMRRDTGWFVKLYDEHESNDSFAVSDNLKQLFKQCVNAGFRMIEFDADAAVYQYLPTFE